MRYFYDTEFVDDGSTIDLISIGIVCEDGRELYLQSVEFDPEKANDWVKENVLNSLLVCPHVSGNVRGLYAHMGQCTFEDPEKGVIGAYADCPWRTREQIKHEIQYFFNPSSKIELFGWCSGYDYVAFCQLWGTMMDLPQGYPHYIKDIQQILDENCISDDMLPKQEGQSHNALEDARYIKRVWEYVA
jgi:hypothetical protein